MPKAKAVLVVVAAMLVAIIAIGLALEKPKERPRDANVVDEKDGASSGFDFVGLSVKETLDKGFVVAGYVRERNQAAKASVLLLKTDGSGNQQWKKTFGEAKKDEGRSVVVTEDGSFVVAGYSLAPYYGGEQERALLLKVSAQGKLLWQKSFGGSGMNDFANAIAKTSDGGFIVAGELSPVGLNNFAYLIRTDSLGNQQWKKTFGKESGNTLNSVVQASDGSFVAVGATKTSGGKDKVFAIRVDASGNPFWEREIGGSGNYVAGSVIAAGNSSFVMAGYLQENGGDWKSFLLKVDSSGKTEWQKEFEGKDGRAGLSVAMSSDGGFVVAGAKGSIAGGNSDAYLLKTDASGNKQWEKAFGGSSNDVAYSIQQASDGGYVVAGYTQSFGNSGWKVYLVKTDALGNKQWEKAFG